MDDFRRGNTYSRFIPARGGVRNGNVDGNGGGPDEQTVDDLKELSIADKAEKEDTTKASTTSIGKELLGFRAENHKNWKAKKQGDEKKAEENKTERDTGAEGSRPRRKQSRKGRDKKDSATAGIKEDK